MSGGSVVKTQFINEWVKPILSGLVVTIITWILKEFWNDMEIKQHIISFIITFSPIIIGFFVFLIYRHILDHIRLRHFNNDLEKWIGLLSYKDDKGSYADLKGKIKRYIREELENGTMSKK